ncbi:MAG: glycosyltransferase 87 family protein [Candidatus Caldarchaeum sp.]
MVVVAVKKPATIQLVLAAAVVSWGLSVYLHHPSVEGNVYSDVASFWWREPYLREGLVPCIQYFFEYPPASCFIVYAARLAGGPPLESYYMAFSALSLPAYLLLAWTLTRLAGRVGAFFILMPSMVVYGIYNFDHFFTALLAASLVVFMDGRHRLAYFLLGMAFSVKLFTVLLLPVYLMERGRRMRNVLEGFGFFAVGALPATAPVLATNPAWVAEFLNYHMSWGLENAWTVWLSADPFSPSAKVVGYLTAAILLLRSYTSQAGLAMKSFLVFSAWLLGSPTFTPQMAIWIIPFAAASPRLWVWVPFFETANAAIIYTWFTTSIPTYPWTLPQTMSLLRASALAAMWFTTYRNQTSLRSLAVLG